VAPSAGGWLLLGERVVNVEQALVLVLAGASTLASGLASDARERTAITPARLALVAAANMVGLPLVAYVLLQIAPFDGAGGVVLAAAAPGGSTGPLLGMLARGDAPTAAFTFVVLTFAGMATALIATMVLDVAGLAPLVVASLVVAVGSLGPLLVGLAIRARRPSLAAALHPWTSRLSLVLLLATIIVLAVEHGHAAHATAVLIGVVLTVLALCIGRLASGRAARVAVAQVSAVRNLTLVMLVLAVVGGSANETMAVLAYGLSMYVVTLAAALWWRSAMKAP
jgi:BASS family bile acid:Na+ symporter